MRNLLRLSVIALVLFVISAWTWPGSKKAKAPETKPAASAQKTAAPSKVSAAPASPVKDDEDAEEKDEPDAETADLTGSVVSPATVPPVNAPKAVSIPKRDLVIAPDQVQTELKQVMEMQKQRQKELESQMQTLRVTLERAKAYNKILNTMYPTLPGGSLTARAVNQEKIRLIHEEVRKMVSIPPMSPAVRSAQIASHQASQARASAFVLPIGKHAPKTPASPQAKTPASASEQG